MKTKLFIGDNYIIIMGNQDIISRRFGKIVPLGQTSLAIPLRGEIIDMGAEKGDVVEITLTKKNEIIIRRINEK